MALESTVLYMRQFALRLCTAESCTAGLIAATLADIPGAGELLDRAFVTYSVAAKITMLGVHAETIERYGLTSTEVAEEMARGALARSAGNIAISNTGVADANGSGADAGVQCMAWAFSVDRAPTRVEVFTERQKFLGGRNGVRKAAAEYALKRLVFYADKLDLPRQVI